jgi:cell division protein FtsL
LRPGKGRADARPRRRTGLLAGRGRLLNIVAVGLVMAALLAVVVAQAMLANGQVRLSALQHQLALEQSAHRQAELSVSQLETPSRIVAAATGQLHMVRPASVIQLPYVSLSVPLATPKVTPAPPPAPVTTTTTPTASTTTGTSTTSATSTTTATSIP